MNILYVWQSERSDNQALMSAEPAEGNQIQAHQLAKG